MKKFYLFLTALLVAASVHASENWVTVQDSVDGDRLLVDSESFAPARGDDGTLFIAAKFMFVTNGEPKWNHYFITEADSCAKKGGPLYMRDFVDGKWVTKHKFWWSLTGTKMFDSAGEALCDILEVRIKENTQRRI